LQQWMGHRDIASTMVYLKGQKFPPSSSARAGRN